MPTIVSLDNMPLLLTVDQLASILQVEPRSLHRWKHTGTIPPPIKIGGSTRWRKADIVAFLDQAGKDVASA